MPPKILRADLPAPLMAWVAVPVKVSIITAVYNDRRVGLALDSVLTQDSHVRVGLIVIDRGSTDGTLDILQQ